MPNYYTAADLMPYLDGDAVALLSLLLEGTDAWAGVADLIVSRYQAYPEKLVSGVELFTMINSVFLAILGYRAWAGAVPGLLDDDS